MCNLKFEKIYIKKKRICYSNMTLIFVDFQENNFQYFKLKDVIVLPRIFFFGRYFKQPELLDRVPFCFLVVGGICASLQLLGTLLIRDPPKTDPQQLIGGEPVRI